ncbi:TetR/AcrR family transcriptional regulator [Nocardioides sp. CPCC 205120]|uniref:TetR/AcrR family transcriptional regulator n=1 Tax=Nocardioides sp. CPCC 205120 TaxID=3406462 RepID=UPI003B505421
MSPEVGPPEPEQAEPEQAAPEQAAPEQAAPEQAAPEQGPRVRRTQAERSRAMRARLVAATIASIAEVGYHRASVGDICARAGVSKGALFRHFPTRTDLVVEAAQEVGRRHLAAFAELRDATTTVEEQLRFARRQIRDATNAVWLELLVASRTEPDLRERLAPAVRELYRGVERAAVGAHGGDGVPDGAVRLAVTSLLHMLDGEALLQATLPRPDLEEERLVAAASLYSAVLTGRLSITDEA